MKIRFVVTVLLLCFLSFSNGSTSAANLNTGSVSGFAPASEMSNEKIGYLIKLSDAELKRIVLGVKQKHKGLNAKALMGLVMKEVSGRASGKRVSELL